MPNFAHVILYFFPKKGPLNLDLLLAYHGECKAKTQMLRRPQILVGHGH